MSSRSLNKVMLIGNLTRDPNLRFTPNNTAVCSFGLATNRTWSSDGGDKQESVEFHNLVAWSKLAEICGQLLHKGDKVYVEGRLQTRSWQGDDGKERKVTEVVIDNMIMLRSSSGYAGGGSDDGGDGETITRPAVRPTKKVSTSKKSEPEEDKGDKPAQDESKEDEVEQVEDVSDDIPF